MNKIVLLILLSLPLASCGVKGDPEPPPSFERAR